MTTRERLVSSLIIPGPWLMAYGCIEGQWLAALVGAVLCITWAYTA